MAPGMTSQRQYFSLPLRRTLLLDRFLPWMAGLVCRTKVFFGGCWVNNGFYFGNLVWRGSTLLGMLLHHFFILGNVDAVDLIVRNITLHPLNLWAEVL